MLGPTSFHSYKVTGFGDPFVFGTNKCTSRVLKDLSLPSRIDSSPAL